MKNFIKALVPPFFRSRLLGWYRRYFRGETPLSSPVITPAKPISEGDFWFFVDYPQDKQVVIHAGVLSVRGWAWSRQHGRGRLWLSIKSASAEAVEDSVRVVPIRHRLFRPDVHQVIPDVPSNGYPGFEVSVDRFDLPDNATVTINFAAGDSLLGSYQYEVLASHSDRIIGTVEVPCNNCLGTKFTIVGRKDNLTLVQCLSCGLVFTNPRPDLETINQRYSASYFEKEYLKDIRTNLKAYSIHWNNTLNEVERFRVISPYLFEVGAGAGYVLDMANKRGWKASGIDINSSAVTYAQNVLGLDVSHGDISSWDLPHNFYGAILLESTLEHFEQPAQVIEKCARALYPGGGLLVWTVTHEGDNFKSLGMDFKYVGPSEHLYYFSASVLCRMCESAGLRVDSIWREASFDSIAVIATRQDDLLEPVSSTPGKF